MQAYRKRSSTAPVWPTRESLAAANRAAALKLAVPGSRIDRDRFAALRDELEAEANGRPPEGNRT